MLRFDLKCTYSLLTTTIHVTIPGDDDYKSAQLRVYVEGDEAGPCKLANDDPKCSVNITTPSGASCSGDFRFDPPFGRQDGRIHIDILSVGDGEKAAKEIKGEDLLVWSQEGERLSGLAECGQSRIQDIAMLAAAAVEPAQAAPTHWATTPQGFLVGLDDDYDWLQVVIANTLTPTDEIAVLRLSNLSPELTDTLQRNHVFAVMSRANDGEGKTYFEVDGRVDIEDWSFDVVPSLPVDQGGKPRPGLGTYLILKFNNKSIEKMVAKPNLWAHGRDFNADPGLVSRYLNQIIQKAASLVHSSAREDERELYQHFVHIVEDPNWNGILALNCQISDRPDTVDAVLTDVIELDHFHAHHIGVNVSYTQQQEALDKQRSIVFGLVDYEGIDPETGHQALAVSDDYAYSVFYLRTVFANSLVQRFNCKIALGVRRWFGVPSFIRNVADSSGQRTDQVVIDGIYQVGKKRPDGTREPGTFSFMHTGKDRDGNVIWYGFYPPALPSKKSETDG
jgi:hypothetical protein